VRVHALAIVAHSALVAIGFQDQVGKFVCADFAALARFVHWDYLKEVSQPRFFRM